MAHPEERGTRVSTVVCLVAFSVLLAACDEMFVGPEGPPPAIAITLSAVVGEPTDPAGLFSEVNRVRIDLRRPDGSHRDTTVQSMHLGDEVRVRLRLIPREVIADLEVEATLYQDVLPLFSGSAVLDTRAGKPLSATVELTPFVANVVPDRARVLLAEPGDTAHLGGRAFMITGTEVFDLPFTWTSDDPGIASVTERGVVTAVSRGATTVRMSRGSSSVGISIEVLPATPFQIWPLTAALSVGESVQFEALLTDESDAWIAPSAPVEWRTVPEKPEVMVVSGDGRVVGLGQGSVTLVASAGSDTIARRIEVTRSATPAEQPLTVVHLGLYVGDLAGHFDRITQGWPTGFPTRSPDLTQIAVEYGGALWVYNTAGEGMALNLGSVTPSWPEYSADGRWIYFEGRHEGVSLIYRIRPDGSGLQPVSPEGAHMPTASPDGTRIAYVSGSSLIVQDLGGFPRPIVTDVSPRTPIWSPDGEWIAFAARGVHLVRPDGSGLRQVGHSVVGQGITWSPDGGWIFGSLYRVPLLFAVSTGEATSLPWTLPLAEQFAWWR